MGFGKYWGYARGGQKFQHNGWNIEVGTFEYTAPEEWAGKIAWRYRMSKNTITQGIWREKNPRGRKFETRCFLSKDEAITAAKATADKEG